MSCKLRKLNGPHMLDWIWCEWGVVLNVRTIVSINCVYDVRRYTRCKCTLCNCVEDVRRSTSCKWVELDSDVLCRNLLLSCPMQLRNSPYLKEPGHFCICDTTGSNVYL